jgi:hypothetical protein
MTLSTRAVMGLPHSSQICPVGSKDSAMSPSVGGERRLRGFKPSAVYLTRLVGTLVRVRDPVCRGGGAGRWCRAGRRAGRCRRSSGHPGCGVCRLRRDWCRSGCGRCGGHDDRQGSDQRRGRNGRRGRGDSRRLHRTRRICRRLSRRVHQNHSDNDRHDDAQCAHHQPAYRHMPMEPMPHVPPHGREDYCRILATSCMENRETAVQLRVSRDLKQVDVTPWIWARARVGSCRRAAWSA